MNKILLERVQKVSGNLHEIISSFAAFATLMAIKFQPSIEKLSGVGCIVACIADRSVQALLLGTVEKGKVHYSCQMSPSSRGPEIFFSRPTPIGGP